MRLTLLVTSRQIGRRSLLTVAVVGLFAATVYLLWFTPLAVYVLDRLNLRPFFLPNIVCNACNNFTYEYMVTNRNFCRNSEGKVQQVFLLILVATFHANLDARQIIRKSWGNVTEYRGRAVRTLFVFGRHDDKNYNYQILYEMEHYADVMQADYTDSYRWLTNKTVASLRWVEQFCGGAQFVLKTDDDAFNVPQRFVDYLLTVNPRDDFVGGYCFTVMPDRRDGSKFYVPYSMYPDQYYPTYCSGPGYVLSRSALSRVLAVSSDVVFLPMEDVFVSGVCRVAARIPYTQIVGVAEDQRQMTHCGLVTWVKNGHNIYPEATRRLWMKVTEADASRDCAMHYGLHLCLLLVFVIVWARHLYSLFHHDSHHI